MQWLTFTQKNLGWARPVEIRLEEPKWSSSQTKGGYRKNSIGDDRTKGIAEKGV